MRSGRSHSSAHSPQTGPKSQLNFLPCQIKVNLQKSSCVQSECARSRLDFPFVVPVWLREGWKWLRNCIRDQRLDCHARRVSQRCSPRSCYLCDAASILTAAVLAGEATTLSQGPLAPSAPDRRPPSHRPAHCRARGRLRLHRQQPCGLREPRGPAQRQQ